MIIINIAIIIIIIIIRARTFRISDEFGAVRVHTRQLVQCWLCAQQLFLDSRPWVNDIAVTSLHLAQLLL